MKTYFYVLSAVLLFASCEGKTTTAKNNAEGSLYELLFPIQKNVSEEVTAEKSNSLLIGGRQYRGYLGERVVTNNIGKQPILGFLGDPVYCTIEDIDRIFIMDLQVDHKNPEYMNSFENLELLTNLRELKISKSNLDNIDLKPLAQLSNLTTLIISDTNFGSVDLSPIEFLTNLKLLNIFDGTNLTSVDFSPLALLTNLEELIIRGNISNIPDLSPLSKLSFIKIENSNLKSFDGLGAPALERLEITMESFETLAPLSNLIYLYGLDITVRKVGCFTSIGKIDNVPHLEWFNIRVNGQLDVTGIDKLSSLVNVDFNTTALVNPQNISSLYNLKILSMTITNENPSIEYLKDLYNLESLYIDGGALLRNETKNLYQVLDVSPLANNHNLKLLRMRYFIIKNISALDNLKNLEADESGHIDLIGSRLFDENEKSVHGLYFTSRGH